MTTIELAVFDMAGTTLNEHGDVYRALRQSVEENGVEVVSMSEDDYNAWLEIARDTSYKNFADNVPNGQAIIDAALAVE